VKAVVAVARHTPEPDLATVGGVVVLSSHLYCKALTRGSVAVVVSHLDSLIKEVLGDVHGVEAGADGLAAQHRAQVLLVPATGSVDLGRGRVMDS
jgi:hypothetical protein